MIISRSFPLDIKTSFWSLWEHLINLFSIEGYLDEKASDNGPPFNSSEFAKLLSSLGIKHTTSSQGYPRFNGFMERHIQIVKTMLQKTLNSVLSRVVLADLRVTLIGNGLPSPAEILHRRNLMMKAPSVVDYNAIREQTRVMTRYSDLRDPLLTPSDSQNARS